MILASDFAKAIEQAIEQVRVTGRRQRVAKEQVYSRSSHGLTWWTVREVGA